MQCSMAMIAWRLMQNMLGDRWTGRLFGLTRLDGSFLISTHYPGPVLQQGMGLFVELQHWTGTLQERVGVLDVLPGMETPGADLLSGQPAPNGTRRNGWQGRNCCHMARQLGSTPMSERNAMGSRQTAGKRCHLGTCL